MNILRVLILVCVFATPAWGQAMFVPQANDPFWKTETGVKFKANLEQSAEVVYGRKPTLNDSGSPCSDYFPLPRGWVCDEKREILLCAPGYHSEAIDSCVPDKVSFPTPKPESSSKPEHLYANKAFWIGSAAMGGSSSALWIGGNICRNNNGVEPCTEHYGSYNAWNGILTGASVFAAPAVFYGCRKEYQNARWCWLIPGIVVGANVGWGIHEARINHPERH